MPSFFTKTSKVNAQKVTPKRDPPSKNVNSSPFAHPPMRFSKEFLHIKEADKDGKEGKPKRSFFKFLKKVIPCTSPKSITKNFSDQQDNEGCKNVSTNGVISDEDVIVNRYTNGGAVVAGRVPEVDDEDEIVGARHGDVTILRPTQVVISVNNVPQFSRNEIIEVRRNGLPPCDDHADLERRKRVVLQRVRDERLARQNATALASKVAHIKEAGSSPSSNGVTPAAIDKGMPEVPPPPPFCKEEMDARKGVVLEAARRRKLLEALALDTIIGAQQLTPQIPEQQGSVSASSEASQVSGGIMGAPLPVSEEHDEQRVSNATFSATFIQPIVKTLPTAAPNSEVRTTLSRFNVPALVFVISEEEAAQRLGELGFEVAREAENPFSNVFRRVCGYRKHRPRLDAIIEGEEYVGRASCEEEHELSNISSNVFITLPTPPESIASSYSESEISSDVSEGSYSVDDSRYAPRAQEALDTLQALEAFMEPATTVGPTRVDHHSGIDEEDSDEGSDDSMIAQNALNSAQALEDLLNNGLF